VSVGRAVGDLPRALFVLGKGGCGRSSVAAALGSWFARRGESTLIVEWTFAEAIAPWFGLPPAGHEAQALGARLWAMNFSLDETLREYFVGHLRLRLLHDGVIKSPHVQRLIHAAPGIAELLFCGRLFWLAELARDEVGLVYDRIVVDAPATGHGAPLFAMPATLAGFQSAGLLGLESRRVAEMFADPARTGALVVTLAEELAVEETLELIPRIRHDLGRPPIGLLVNRSVDRFLSGDPRPDWLEDLVRRSPPDGPALRMSFAELLGRKERERTLCAELQGATQLGTVALDERLLEDESATPLAVVRGMTGELDRWLGGPP
jgi:Anion-transporting ATPase